MTTPRCGCRWYIQEHRPVLGVARVVAHVGSQSLIGEVIVAESNGARGRVKVKERHDVVR